MRPNYAMSHEFTINRIVLNNLLFNYINSSIYVFYFQQYNEIRYM